LVFYFFENESKMHFGNCSPAIAYSPYLSKKLIACAHTRGYLALSGLGTMAAAKKHCPS